MQDTITIDDRLAVFTSQPTAEQLQQAAEAGFCSVMNLRVSEESGFVSDEGQSAEAAGLEYAHAPFAPGAIEVSQMDGILDRLDELPKPVLLHCKSGVRSAVTALMFLATRDGLSASEATERGLQLGIDISNSPVQSFFQAYLRDRAQP